MEQEGGGGFVSDVVFSGRWPTHAAWATNRWLSSCAKAPTAYPRYVCGGREEERGKKRKSQNVGDVN